MVTVLAILLALESVVLAIAVFLLAGLRRRIRYQMALNVAGKLTAAFREMAARESLERQR